MVFPVHFDVGLYAFLKCREITSFTDIVSMAFGLLQGLLQIKFCSSYVKCNTTAVRE